MDFSSPAIEEVGVADGGGGLIGSAEEDWSCNSLIARPVRQAISITHDRFG
jgi:hypothetical protein